MHTNLQAHSRGSDPMSGSIFAILGSPCPTRRPDIQDTIQPHPDRILAWQ